VEPIAARESTVRREGKIVGRRAWRRSAKPIFRIWITVFLRKGQSLNRKVLNQLKGKINDSTVIIPLLTERYYERVRSVITEGYVTPREFTSFPSAGAGTSVQIVR
jgi:hypothetical protein